MLAADLIAKIIKMGGRIWLEENKVRAHLPETLRPLVSIIQSQKQELIAELIRRPAMPAGIQLIRWKPKDPPIQLSRFETVKDVGLFVESTLRQIDARLHGKNWRAGNWTLSALIDRLGAVGCHVVLDDPQKAVQ